MTIAAQMQELLRDDDRTSEDIAERYGCTRQNISKIRRGETTCGTDLAAQYLADLGWQWKIRGAPFAGHPGEQLRAYLLADSDRLPSLVRSEQIDDRTATLIKTRPRALRILTIDRISAILGITWITVEMEVVA